MLAATHSTHLSCGPELSVVEFQVFTRVLQLSIEAVQYKQ